MRHQSRQATGKLHVLKTDRVMRCSKKKKFSPTGLHSSRVHLRHGRRYHAKISIKFMVLTQYLHKLTRHGEEPDAIQQTVYPSRVGRRDRIFSDLN